MNSIFCNKKWRLKYLNSNNKGFTLIEILSVVIIIGIIGIIGVASVSEYIEDSRKSAFVTTAKNYIEAARSLEVSNKLVQEPKNTEAVLIPLSMLELEDNEDFKTSYGVINDGKSYVIIVNNNNKLTYYITLIDSTNHALLMESAEEFSKDSIQVGTIALEEVPEHQILKDNAVGMSIQINGKSYTVSSNDYKVKKEDGSYVTTTILLDCNIVDLFSVEVEQGWTNRDKKITIQTVNTQENYKYYLSNKSMKPLKNDPDWSDSNIYEKDMGTYYAFVKTDAGEISETVSVIVDKVDKVAPICSIEKSNIGTTAGVTTSVTCSDSGSGCSSSNTTGGTGLKADTTYTITDNVGNTTTCTVTVTKQLQKRVLSCTNCEECESSTCSTYSYKCTCGSPSGASCTSSTKTGTGGCSSVCGFTGGCGYSQVSSWCSTYKTTTSCSRCGCEGWQTGVAWSDATSCTSGQSSDHSSKTECQTLYN